MFDRVQNTLLYHILDFDVENGANKWARKIHREPYFTSKRIFVEVKKVGAWKKSLNPLGARVHTQIL